MSTEALPVAETPEASEQPNALEQAAQAQVASDKPAEAQADDAKHEGEEQKPDGEQKPPKTPEQREIERLRRRIDARTKRVGTLESQLAELTQRLQSPPIERDNGLSASDSDELRLTRAELAALIEQRASSIAPDLVQRQATQDRRESVIRSLATGLGEVRFNELAADLDAAFGGLKDARGTPRPAAEALFEAENPQALIEYLADPENEAEARELSRLSAIQAGRAIARLEDKLAAKQKEAKPEPSKLPQPIEPPRAQGKVSKDPSDMTDREFAEWRRAQIKAR